MNWTFILKIIVIVILSLLCLAIFAYNIYIFCNMFSKKAPYVGSFARHLKIMKKKLKLKKGATLLDLGCGDGKAMRFFRKNFDLGQIDGYEINIFAIVRSRIIHLFLKPKKLKIYKKNFIHAEIPKYDYIYVYLLPDQLASIEWWLFDCIKKDAIVITNSFQFPKKKPFKVYNNPKGKKSIFLYKK